MSTSLICAELTSAGLLPPGDNGAGIFNDYSPRCRARNWDGSVSIPQTASVGFPRRRSRKFSSLKLASVIPRLLNSHLFSHLTSAPRMLRVRTWRAAFVRSSVPFRDRHACARSFYIPRHAMARHANGSSPRLDNVSPREQSDAEKYRAKDLSAPRYENETLRAAR